MRAVQLGKEHPGGQLPIEQAGMPAPTCVVGADEHIAQDPQRAQRGRHIQPHEAAHALLLAHGAHLQGGGGRGGAQRMGRGSGQRHGRARRGMSARTEA